MSVARDRQTSHLACQRQRDAADLCTKMEIAQKNCCLRTSDNQDSKHKEHKTKHIEDLMRPKQNKIAVKNLDHQHLKLF
jgi:hypothetical protein